jgi:hypothetical protein
MPEIKVTESSRQNLRLLNQKFPGCKDWMFLKYNPIIVPERQAVTTKTDNPK